MQFIAPADLTLPDPGAYGLVDVSAHVGAAARAAILRVRNSNSVDAAWDARRPGDAVEVFGDLNYEGQSFEIAGLDAGRRFDLRRGHARIAVEVIGWCGGEVTILDSRIDVTPASASGYQTVSILPHLGGQRAVAAMLVYGTESASMFARPYGGPDDLRARVDNRQPAIVKVDAVGRFEAYRSSPTQRIWLVGFATAGFSLQAAAPDATPPAANVWTDYLLPPGAIGGVFWGVAGLDDRRAGLRKDGSGLAWNSRLNRAAGLYIVEAASRVVETLTDSVTSGGPKLYELGIVEAVAADVVGQPDDLAVGVAMDAASGAVSDDDVVGQPADLAIAVTADAVTGAIEVDDVRGQPADLAVSVAIDEPAGRHGMRRGRRLVLMVARPFDDTVLATVGGPPAPIAGAPIAGDLAYPAVGAERAVYWSDGPYVTKASDDPPHQPFRPALVSSFNFEARLWAGAEPSGEAQQSFGEVTVANADGALDAVARLGWSGRALELYRAWPDDPFSAAAPFFRGVPEAIGWDAGALQLALLPRVRGFDRPLAAAAYGGTGGRDGHADLRGQPKPVSLGYRQNVALTLIDPANLVYQGHLRRCHAFDAVRDQGSPLAFAGDHPAYEDLVAASISGGQYLTCLAEGMVRVHSAFGAITADIRGDAVGGYVQTTAAIVRRIATDFLGADSLADPGGLDTESFAAVEAAQPAIVQFPAGQEAPTIRTALTALMGGIGGWWRLTDDGRLSIGIFEAPSDPTDVIDRRLAAGARRAAVRPSWRRRVAWSTLNAVQAADSLAGLLSAEAREFYATRARYAPAFDTAVRTREAQAADPLLESCFVFEADAAAEASRQLGIWGVLRDVWHVPASSAAMRFRLGQTVTLDLGRYGMPRPVTVIGRTIDLARGTAALELIG